MIGVEKKPKSKLNQNHAGENVAIVFGTPAFSNRGNGVIISFAFMDSIGSVDVCLCGGH